MSDTKKTFHEIALHSVLFKGRHDWYFCYLKSEKIAHVLALLAQKVSTDAREEFKNLVETATTLPATIVHFAAGEVDMQVLLADVFSLLSMVRIGGTRGIISSETALLLAQEYEGVAEKILSGSTLSPFVSQQDFSVSEVEEGRQEREGLLHTTTSQLALSASSKLPAPYKRHSKGLPSVLAREGEKDRSTTILEIVRERKAVSIKDIGAIVRNCSEKTIQRELIQLIEKGLITREGERRWSVYKPSSI